MQIPVLSPIHMLLLITLSAISGGVSGKSMELLGITGFWLAVFLFTGVIVRSAKRINPERVTLCRVMGTALLLSTGLFAGAIAATLSFLGTHPLIYWLVGALGSIFYMCFVAYLSGRQA